MKPFYFLIFAGLLISASAIHAQAPAYAQQQQERRIADLESKVSDLQHKSPSRSGADIGGAAILFAAFCALWAQNTGRSAWLWFFLGLFFSVITVIVLLVKNSNDRFRKQQAERFAHLRPHAPRPS